VIDEMSAAGQGDPGVAGGDHVRAGVAGENEHCQPAYEYRRAGQCRAFFGLCGLSHFCSLTGPLIIWSSEWAKL